MTLSGQGTIDIGWIRLSAGKAIVANNDHSKIKQAYFMIYAIFLILCLYRVKSVPDHYTAPAILPIQSSAPSQPIHILSDHKDCAFP